jgi:hypothetical protein
LFRLLAEQPLVQKRTRAQSIGEKANRGIFIGRKINLYNRQNFVLAKQKPLCFLDRSHHFYDLEGGEPHFFLAPQPILWSLLG